MRRAWSWPASLCGALLLGACGRCGSGTESAITTDASGAADASEASSDASVGCIPTRLQPDFCAPPQPELALGGEAIDAWFKARGVATEASSLTKCREVVLGAEGEHDLVCVEMQPLAVDPGLGTRGPVEFRYDLEIVTARGKKRVELLRVPFAMGGGSGSYTNYSDLLFSARYTVDAPAGTVDVVASTAECATAQEMLKPYWDAQAEKLRAMERIPAGIREALIHAYDLARVSDAARITATCHAAGPYVRGRDGRFVKAAK